MREYHRLYFQKDAKMSTSSPEEILSGVDHVVVAEPIAPQVTSVIIPTRQIGVFLKALAQHGITRERSRVAAGLEANAAKNGGVLRAAAYGYFSTALIRDLRLFSTLARTSPDESFSVAVVPNNYFDALVANAVPEQPVETYHLIAAVNTTMRQALSTAFDPGFGTSKSGIAPNL